MDVCKKCGKELVHAEGRRKKTFCNDTCRSNYWYDINVKNKPKSVVRNLNQPTNKVEPPTQPTAPFVIDTTTEQQIADLEEKRKNLPPGQYFNKMYKLYTDQINKLKTQK